MKVLWICTAETPVPNYLGLQFCIFICSV